MKPKWQIEQNQIRTEYTDKAGKYRIPDIETEIWIRNNNKNNTTNRSKTKWDRDQ